MAIPPEEHLSEAVSDFALRLYKAVCRQQGNVLFSPLNIHTAVCMILAGAKADTLEQMKKALRVGSVEDTLREIRDMVCHLNSASISSQVKIGNRIFVEEGLAIADDYKSLTREVFQAECGLVSFLQQPSVARDVINSWVSEITNGKIDEALKAIRQRTRLMLVSAIYFKGFWAEKFPELSTCLLPFRANSKLSVETEMMHQSMMVGFAHYSELKATVISLPYEHKAISMVVILPDDVEGLRSVEQNLDLLKLNKILIDVGQELRKVDVFLPKFKLEETLNLQPLLSEMGMVDAFWWGKADLTGIVDDTSDLHVAQVTHKAYLEVNEEGTEAAATTSDYCVDGIQVLPEFCADRPFVFLIVENKRNLILFIGAFKTPEAP